MFQDYRKRNSIDRKKEAEMTVAFPKAIEILTSSVSRHVFNYSHVSTIVW